MRLVENARIFLSAQNDIETACHTIERRQEWLKKNTNDKSKSEDVRRVTVALKEYKEGFVGFLATYLEAVKLGVQTMKEFSSFSEEDTQQALSQTREYESLERLQRMVMEGSFVSEVKRIIRQARKYLFDFVTSGEITEKNQSYCEQEMQNIEALLKTL